MSRKNYAGNILHRNTLRMERLVDHIDNRSKRGSYDAEQAQDKALNYRVGGDGARVWTF